MIRPVVCSIGCTDPWNAAGLGLDIVALRELGTRPVTVVAGVTAQDGGGLRAAHAIPARIVAAQLESLRAAPIAACRIGALLDPNGVEAIAAWLERTGLPAVYDPVLAPSAGGTFATGQVVEGIVRKLLPHVTLVTPNYAEVLRLAAGERPASLEAAVRGVAAREASGDDPGDRVNGSKPDADTRPESDGPGASPTAGIEAMEGAARALLAGGARAVLVTGGDLSGATAVDVLVDANGTAVFEAPRFPGTMRGTGCLLACGIAAALAHGSPLRDAVAAGRDFVRERFARAVTLGGARVAY
jgi:hydroxymethylpyrimidine/phosphomethylpyrimidine kinase